MAKKSKMDDVGDKLDKLLEFMMADAKSTKADRTKDKGEKTEKDRLKKLKDNNKSLKEATKGAAASTAAIVGLTASMFTLKGVMGDLKGMNSKVSKALSQVNRAANGQAAALAKFNGASTGLAQNIQVFGEAVEMGMSKFGNGTLKFATQLKAQGVNNKAVMGLMRNNTQALGLSEEGSLSLADSLVSTAAENGDSINGLISALKSMEDAMKVTTVVLGPEAAQRAQEVAAMMSQQNSALADDAAKFVASIMDGSKGYLKAGRIASVQMTGRENSTMEVAEKFAQIIKGINNVTGGMKGAGAQFALEEYADKMGLTMADINLAQQLEAEGWLQPLLDGNTKQRQLELSEASTTQALLNASRKTQEEGLGVMTGIAKSINKIGGWMNGYFMGAVALFTSIAGFAFQIWQLIKIRKTLAALGGGTSSPGTSASGGGMSRIWGKLKGFGSASLIGIKRFGSVLKSGGSKLLTSFKGLGSVLKSGGSKLLTSLKGFGSVLKSGGSKLLTSFKGFGSVLKSGGSKLLTSFKGVGSKLLTSFKGFGSILKSGGSKLLTSFRGMGSILSSGGSKLLTSLKGFGSVLSSGGSKLLTSFRGAGSVLSSAGSKLLTSFKSFGSILSSGGSKFVNALKSAGSSLAEGSSGFFKSFKGFGKFLQKKLPKGLTKTMKRFGSSLLSGSSKLLGNLSSFGGSLLKKGGPFFDAMKAAGSTLVESGSKFSKAVGAVGSKLASTASSFAKKIAQSAATQLAGSAAGTGIWLSIKAAMVAAFGWLIAQFKSLGGWIKNIAKSAGGWIKDIAKSAWGGVKNIANTTLKYTKSAFKSMGGWMSKWGSKIMGGAGKLFSRLGGFLKPLAPLLGGIAKKIPYVGAAITGVFRGIETGSWIEGIKRAVVSAAIWIPAGILAIPSWGTSLAAAAVLDTYAGEAMANAIPGGGQGVHHPNYDPTLSMKENTKNRQAEDALTAGNSPKMNTTESLAEKQQAALDKKQQTTEKLTKETKTSMMELGLNEDSGFTEAQLDRISANTLKNLEFNEEIKDMTHQRLQMEISKLEESKAGPMTQISMYLAQSLLAMDRIVSVNEQGNEQRAEQTVAIETGADPGFGPIGGGLGI